MEMPLLLPQQAPMVMVDALLSYTESGAVTRLEIRPDNIFVHDGHFTEPGLVENIAQTAAAHAGYTQTRNGASIAPVGYIAAVDQLQIFRLPPVFSIIETTIRIQHQVLNVTIIGGDVTCDGQPVARCEMKIFLRSRGVEQTDGG